MDVTEESLASALEGFYVEVADRGGSPVHCQITDADSMAAALYATLSRMAALREPPGPQNVPPAYYDGKGGMQPFDVIDAFGLDFYEGSALKYLLRWRRKGQALSDLRKCSTYIRILIERYEQENAVSETDT